MLKLIKIFLFTAIFTVLLPLSAFADTNVEGDCYDDWNIVPTE